MLRSHKPVIEEAKMGEGSVKLRLLMAVGTRDIARLPRKARTN